MTPRISVLLPAMGGYDTVLAALDAWEGQTGRDQLEILVLCPDGPRDTESLPPGQRVITVGSATLHEARAIGIGHATGDYLMLAEDHCLPERDWTQVTLARLAEGWDGVCSGLRPGNRRSHWADASFLIGYGEWMMPIKGGPTKVLCGWNGTVRTSLLRQMGSELAHELFVGAFLVRRLRDEGRSFYLDESAHMKHFDPSGGAFALYSLTVLGMSFGARRTLHWAFPARMLYPLTMPAVIFLHWKRALVQYRRAGAEAGLRPTSPAIALVLAAAWGMGEALGSWLGVARVLPFVWRAEVKPVSREDANR